MPRQQVDNTPCALVYTLLSSDLISFDDFFLLVRGLHSYMVESVTPNAELSIVTVRLQYQASVVNAQNKLGALANCVSVSKLNANIQESEYSKLEELKKKFGIIPSNQNEASTSYQKPKFGKSQKKIFFKPRGAPYKVPKQPQVQKPELYSESSGEDQE